MNNIKELLLDKGFKLNHFDDEILGEYNVFEFETSDEEIIENILGSEYQEEEKLILQCNEKFENCILYTSFSLDKLSFDDFMDYVNKI